MANGATLTDKLKVSWPVLIALLALTVGVVSTFGSLSASVATHQANCDIHHATADLDARYMNKEFALDRWTKLELRLLRFEDKLDMLLRK